MHVHVHVHVYKGGLVKKRHVIIFTKTLTGDSGGVAEVDNVLRRCIFFKL